MTMFGVFFNYIFSAARKQKWSCKTVGSLSLVSVQQLVQPCSATRPYMLPLCRQDNRDDWKTFQRHLSSLYGVSVWSHCSVFAPMSTKTSLIIRLDKTGMIPREKSESGYKNTWLLYYLKSLTIYWDEKRQVLKVKYSNSYLYRS